jgi:non-ribosomal peptide synthetase component F
MKSDIYTRLSRIARTAGVPLRSVLLSGWICLMYRYTGQNDLVVGSKVRRLRKGTEAPDRLLDWVASLRNFHALWPIAKCLRSPEEKQWCRYLWKLV